MADKILSFGGLLLDGWNSDTQEQQREVRIFYHLEDDTLRVVETPTSNAGCVQGTLVGRQRVPCFSHPQAPYVRLHHFKVGETVSMFGRRYLVTSCDPATRTYLTSLGRSQPLDLTHPSLTAYQEQLPAASPAAGVGKLQFSSEWPRQHPLATFVNKGSQVLRFFGEWVAEDKAVRGVTSPVTERVELRYYLEDDTVELRLHHLTPHQNALTPATPRQPVKILKRGPLPKNMSELNGAASLGAVGRPTLNLVGLRGGYAHLKDRRPQALASPDFVQVQELVLGATVSVGGRLVRLCECDTFTTNYYKNVLGIDQHPVGYQYLEQSVGMPPFPRQEPLDPRWLEEHPRDPLHPLPTTVTIKVGGFHAKTLRDGSEGTILHFAAKLITGKEKDKEREFVINFYVFDSTISVFEVPKLNSGMRAGTFLSRNLVVSGNEDPPGGGDGHVRGQELFAGATVKLNSHVFLITGCDEFTLNYMEKHADEFPQANYNVALDEARRVLGHHELTSLAHQMTSFDPTRCGFVKTSILTEALKTALGASTLNLQQVITLVRRHRRLTPSPLSRENLTHLASLHIKRHNFDGLNDLKTCLQGQDVDGLGRVKSSIVRSSLAATKLPLTSTLMDALTIRVTEADGMVDYNQLCQELDWRLRPHIHDNLPCQLDEASLELALQHNADEVDYIGLIADLEGSANTHHLAGSGLV